MSRCSSNSREGDGVSLSLSLSLSPSPPPESALTPSSKLIVQAEHRIAPSSTSKPFPFDLFRFISIFYNQQQKSSTDSVQSPKHKILKVTNQTDGTLTCESDPLGWTYKVRLAANCFEQNLIAIPVPNSLESSVQVSSRACAATALSPSQLRILLRATRPIEAGEELSFWPSFDLNLALGIPFLSPSNIINGTCYVCTVCGQSYTQPNPLKIHLKFTCPLMTPQSLSQNIFPQPSSTANKSQYLLTTVHANSPLHEPSPFALDKLRSLNGRKCMSKSSKHHGHDSGHRKLHNCSYCGKVYTRKYGLKIHIRTHTGLKPLSCRFCGRSFSDPSNLNKHVRLHGQMRSSSPKFIRA